jgi:spermidine synthase
MDKKKDARQDQKSEIREYHTPSSGFFFKIKKNLHSKKSNYQNIELIENETFGKILLLDGLVQTTDRDEFCYHEMMAHPACVVHPSPVDILIIGGGDGGILREALKYAIRNVHLVEIDAEVIAVSKQYFPWMKEILKDNRVTLVINDGVNFVKNTSLKFDVVFIDSSEPVGPSAVLHEKLFYELLKKRLQPEGIIVAQVASPFFHSEFIEQKMTFFRELFRFSSLYLGPVPTYPGGCWCYAFLSDLVHPFDIKRDPPPGLRYYNPDIHKAAFALPNDLIF